MIYRDFPGVNLDYLAAPISDSPTHPNNGTSTGLLAIMGNLLLVGHTRYIIESWKREIAEEKKRSNLLLFFW